MLPGREKLSCEGLCIESLGNCWGSSWPMGGAMGAGGLTIRRAGAGLWYALLQV